MAYRWPSASLLYSKSRIPELKHRISWLYRRQPEIAADGVGSNLAPVLASIILESVTYPRPLSYASPAPGATALLLSAVWSHFMFFVSLAGLKLACRSVHLTSIVTQTSELSLDVSRVDSTALDRPMQEVTLSPNCALSSLLFIDPRRNTEPCWHDAHHHAILTSALTNSIASGQEVTSSILEPSKESGKLRNEDRVEELLRSELRSKEAFEKQEASQRV